MPIPVYASCQAFRQSLQHQEPSPDSSQQTRGKAVEAIIRQVRQQGDSAIYELAQRFGDSLQPTDAMALSAERWQEACERVSPRHRETLELAARNIRQFAQAWVEALPKTLTVPFEAGYQAGYRFQAVEAVACYVPGGRYPLASTALMTALPARVAGVAKVYVCCPNPSDEVLLAAKLAGADAVFTIGGAQAIAAFAYGTESIPAVDMIVGPGNAYVAEAKRQLQGQVGIDMLAGPSEVVVVADASANPEWVAADLLAQAEHDPDARGILLTLAPELVVPVKEALERLAKDWRLPDYVLEQALPNSAIVTCASFEEALMLSDALAPEHLQLHLGNAASVAQRFQHFGTLFIGPDAPVPYGDYLAGPNHTLPTQRNARFSGGLSPLTFLQVRQWLEVAKPNAVLSRHTQTFAELEGLTAHAQAARLRYPG
jgi:histidinol dehydrogenase